MEVDEEEVQKYYEKYGSYPQTVATKEAYQELQIEFTAPEEIAEIKKNLVYRQYGSEFGPFPELETFLNVIVYFQREIDSNTVLPWDEQVVAWSENYRFLKDSIPQFVIERLLEAKTKTLRRSWAYRLKPSAFGSSAMGFPDQRLRAGKE